MTSKGKGGRRYMPYVFTEQGIAMLSAVLRSDIAIQISIRIMETFIEMRRFFGHNSLMLDRINEVEVKQLAFQKDAEEKFDIIFSHISEYEESNQKIFFSGQIYDAFRLLIELVLKADNKLVLIDNYVDINTLNILAKKKTNVKVIIYTSKKTKLSQMDINIFNQQYQSLEVKYTDEFHNRFMIIDDTTAYHIGASIKDAGKKCFGINLIEDSKIIQDIFARIKISST